MCEFQCSNLIPIVKWKAGFILIYMSLQVEELLLIKISSLMPFLNDAVNVNKECEHFDQWYMFT